MYYDSVQPRSLRLFDALLLHADEHEKAALLSIIDDKPHRNDLRDVPQLSTARQLMELLEFLAKNADEQSRGDFPAKADILRARIVMRGDVDMDRARHKCAGAAIHAILGRIAKDPAAAFSGILFDKVLRTRSPIPRELILNAEVYWTGDDNACLHCVGGSFVYTFQLSRLRSRHRGTVAS